MIDSPEFRARFLERLRALGQDERTELIELAAAGTAVSPEEIETLLQTPEANDFLNTGGPLAGPLGDRLIELVADLDGRGDLVGGTVGDVEILEVLGHGGFGRVYLGHDPKLERRVAVKALRSTQRSSEDAQERLRREARLLSKLDHRNVCRIYGLVEEADRDYLLLEYIAGDRLTEAAAGKTSEERLELVRQVAEALAAAHDQGIIHRDLKPDNVLVTPDGVVKVLDLGIARFEADLPDEDRGQAAAGSSTGSVREGTGSSSERDLTRRGSKVGTIRYMSPEQARGKTLTTASDLFSFGLLLHELFGGKPVYAAESSEELFEKVRGGQTAAFEHQDEGLAALIAELLAHEPDARPTAAEAVRRIESLLDRPRQQRRRQVRRLAAGLAAVAVVGVLLGWWMLRRQAANEIAVAEELLTQVKDIEWRMRAEYLSPPHDINAARSEVRLELEELVARNERLGARAGGRGHYGLGRAAYAVGDVARAREEMEKAWESGYQTPEVAFTLGRILARRFRDEVEWSDRRFGAAEHEERFEKLRQEFGVPAARFLEIARAAEVEAPNYVESLLAVNELEYQKALDLLSDIELSWLYEGHLLTGWIELKLARAQQIQGSVEAFADHARRAEAAYERAASVGRSDPLSHTGLCRARNQTIYRSRLTAEESLRQVERAVEACQAAIELDHEHVEARWELVSTHYSAAQAAFDRGEEATEHLRLAEEAGEEGLAVGSGSADLQRSLVKVLWRKAVAEQLRGEDPGETYERGRAMAEPLAMAEAAPAADMQNYVLLAIDQSLYQSGRGLSPVDTLEKAILVSKRSVEVEPDSAGLTNLAICYYVLARYQADHGIEPAESLAEGLAAVGRALEAVPDQLVTLRTLGNLHLVAHRHVARTGGDTSEHLAAARAAYRRAVEVNPDFVWARLEWLVLEHQDGYWAMERGESPEEAIATSREQLEAMRAAEGLEFYLLSFGGRLDLLEGRWQASRGLSPDDAFDRAEDALRRAAAISDLEAGPLQYLAHLFSVRAERSLESGQAGTAALIEEGLVAADQAIGAQADLAEAHWLRAELLRLEAQLVSGSNRIDLTREAEQAEARACALNRYLPGCADRSG